MGLWKKIIKHSNAVSFTGNIFVLDYSKDIWYLSSLNRVLTQNELKCLTLYASFSGGNKE